MGRLTVRLTPRGGADRIEGWARDAEGRPLLKARVAAAPTDGAANAALERLLAKALGRPPSSVRIAAGQTARVKQVEVEGMAAGEIAAALGLASGPPGQA